MRHLGITLGIVVALMTTPQALWSNVDYKFFDTGGREIQFPVELPLFHQDSPGAFKRIKGWEGIGLKYRVREEGLEDIWMLDIMIPNPFKEEDEARIKAVYILDKDNLIIAYEAFDEDETSFRTQKRINGIINYIKVFVEVETVGLWGKEYHLS